MNRRPVLGNDSSNYANPVQPQFHLLMPPQIPMPISLTSFIPIESQSSAHSLDHELGRNTYPSRSRQLIDQWYIPPVTRQVYESRFSKVEQNKALDKLKKSTYNPFPKGLISSKTNLYYRDLPVNEKARKIDDNGKRCAICLEDFQARQEVILTPCNHMFHEECIVPWAKSNGQCPVCRFFF